MNPGSPELERLISRYLDDEATAHERRELRALMRSDAAVAAEVEQYDELDREVGWALRRALGRSQLLPTVRSTWGRVGQLVALAAAASMAVMVWVSPPRQVSPGQGDTPARAASWFAPATPVSHAPDGLQTVNPSHERPRVRLRETDRDWIIIPGERPGEFMVIEVNRVRTRAIVIQREF